MNLFYAIWADAIYYERLKNGGEGHWKRFTFCSMSLLLSINIATIFMSVFLISDYNITQESKEVLDRVLGVFSTKFIWYLIVILTPSAMITYFSIFYRRRYDYILDRYPFKNGLLLLIYFLITFISFFLLAWLVNN